jgi:hypothetical protein
VTARPAVSALTIGNYHTLLRYCLDNKIIVKSLNVTTPVFLDPLVLPLAVRSQYIDNYKNDYDGPSWTVVRLKAPLQREVTIVGVHFPSKLHWDDLSQSFECINLINKIRKYEVDKTLKNTILIGDFNMNPFEPGMIASVGIHGVKDKKIALKNFRSIQTTDYDFFYNPMWNFLGDRQPPAGTYYYPKSIHLSHFWNTYDQILFRPQLMRDYEESSLKIVQHIGKKNLLNGRGKPSKTYSDHLPIFVSFNLIK